MKQYLEKLTYSFPPLKWMDASNQNSKNIPHNHLLHNATILSTEQHFYYFKKQKNRQFLCLMVTSKPLNSEICRFTIN